MYRFVSFLKGTLNDTNVRIYGICIAGTDMSTCMLATASKYLKIGLSGKHISVCTD